MAKKYEIRLKGIYHGRHLPLIDHDLNPPIIYKETPQTLTYEEYFDGFKCYKEHIETVGHLKFPYNG